MKKTYIKPSVEIFRFDHLEMLAMSDGNLDINPGGDPDDEVTDPGDAWSNKRDWSNTDSKSFWK